VKSCPVSAFREVRSIILQPRHSACFCAETPVITGTQNDHGGCCQREAFLILRDIEDHTLPSLQGHRVIAANGAKPEKYIFAFIASDEAGAYLRTEPFDFPRRHLVFPPFGGRVDDKLMQLTEEGNTDKKEAQ
jgi:hypothetical protein